MVSSVVRAIELRNRLRTEGRPPSLLPRSVAFLLAACRRTDSWREISLLVISPCWSATATVGSTGSSRTDFEAARPSGHAGDAGLHVDSGLLIGWVADHRRHHRFADRPGDPIPRSGSETSRPMARGLWHAHLGWCFPTTPPPRTLAPDLLATAPRVIDRLFLRFAPSASVALQDRLPGRHARRCGDGAAVGRHRSSGRHAQHHVVDHFHRSSIDDARSTRTPARMSRSCSTHDGRVRTTITRSRGRRGTGGPHQLDSSARLIRWFEQLGWAANVTGLIHANSAPRRSSGSTQRRDSARNAQERSTRTSCAARAELGRTFVTSSSPTWSTHPAVRYAVVDEVDDASEHFEL